MTNSSPQIKKKLDFVLWGLSDEDKQAVLDIIEKKCTEVEILRDKLANVSCVGCGKALEGGGLCEDCQIEETERAMEEGLIE
jgi:hypothetical protein